MLRCFCHSPRTGEHSDILILPFVFWHIVLFVNTAGAVSRLAYPMADSFFKTGRDKALEDFSMLTNNF